MGQNPSNCRKPMINRSNLAMENFFVNHPINLSYNSYRLISKVLYSNLQISISEWSVKLNQKITVFMMDEYKEKYGLNHKDLDLWAGVFCVSREFMANRWRFLYGK
jgi:hypothetical protein